MTMNTNVAVVMIAQIYCEILEFLYEITELIDELNFRVARFFICNRQLNDFTFTEVFGVSVVESELIYHRLGRYLARKTRRNRAVTGKEAFLMVMFYLRTGCTLKAAGLAVRGKRQTVALNIRRFVNGVLQELSNEISMNKSEQEWNAHMIRMYLFCGIPLVVGGIDGTHIPIANTNDDSFYFSRHGVPSINVLVACDSNKKIIYVNSNYPGSYHDHLIYRLSSLCKTIDQGWRPGNKYGFLADFAYPTKACLFAYRRPHPGEEEVYR
ncbi:hypothetical protein FO519_006301 [Halicephalobus sp. NKZ332]|nr:hypothetical protein FO519_006301 [Halicephalobus sp. NKZ332]